MEFDRAHHEYNPFSPNGMCLHCSEYQYHPNHRGFLSPMKRNPITDPRPGDKMLKGDAFITVNGRGREVVKFINDKMGQEVLTALVSDFAEALKGAEILEYGTVEGKDILGE